MADEDRVLEFELIADLDDVVGITLERGILGRIVGLEIGAARADMIEQHGPEPVLEGRRNMPPHVLVAAEAMREHHRGRAGAFDVNIVASDC